MPGILLIDKPKTWTSFDAVNYVRKIARQAAQNELTANSSELLAPLPKIKVGHTGTLDPLATGLLVILIGKEYTRRAGELSKQDKTYEVTMKLGEISTTEDEEGEKTVVSSTAPTEKAILKALESLQGRIMQIPSAYSAMKVGGQRAYKLARLGKTVELEARPVTIYSSKLTGYDYPYVRFTSRVSSGTYIRALVRDIGQLLETGAYLADLRRTEIGPFNVADAVEPQDLSAAVIQQRLKELD